jgi:hypothetical protein
MPIQGDLPTLGPVQLHARFMINVCKATSTGARSMKITSAARARKLQQRHVFLYDHLLLFAKQRTTQSPAHNAIAVVHHYDYKGDLPVSNNYIQSLYICTLLA